MIMLDGGVNMGHFTDKEKFLEIIEKNKKLVSLLEKQAELEEKGEFDSEDYTNVVNEIVKLRIEIRDYEDQ